MQNLILYLIRYEKDKFSPNLSSVTGPNPGAQNPYMGKPGQHPGHPHMPYPQGHPGYRPNGYGTPGGPGFPPRPGFPPNHPAYSHMYPGAPGYQGPPGSHPGFHPGQPRPGQNYPPSSVQGTN